MLLDYEPRVVSTEFGTFMKIVTVHTHTCSKSWTSPSETMDEFPLRCTMRSMTKMRLALPIRSAAH